jgi:hypothetical protein
VADGPLWELDGKRHESLAGMLHGLASLPKEAA